MSEGVANPINAHARDDEELARLNRRKALRKLNYGGPEDSSE